jgi:carboxyl-terminal processing protease
MRNFISFLSLLLSLCSAAGAFASRPFPDTLGELTSGTAGTFSADRSVVGRAVALISQGKFEQAGELLHQNSSKDPNLTGQLLKIVEQYRALNENSKQTQEKSYSEKLAAMDKARAAVDANGLKDVNDVTKALAAIVNVSDAADKNQREKLLSDAFVKKVFQAATDRAADYETQGKWLEAYSTCYAWLAVIDPNNKAYSKYSQQLYDKAVIAASFEDSPCESRKERYEGVDKIIFGRAITYLDMYFVDPIDYNDVAAKAIERCQLLGDTVKFHYDDILKSASDANSAPAASIDVNALSVWQTGLSILSDSIKKSPTSLKLESFLIMFDKVLKLNIATINIPESVLVAHFSEAALSAYDPYTVIVWPRQIESFEKTMTNEFSGIGIEISKPKGFLTIASLLPDTPAFKAGLDAGDIIEAIDGVSASDMSLGCAVRKITGPRGTPIKLKIKRLGDIVITRDKIVVPTVRGWQRTETGKWLYMIDDQNEIGYVRLTSFAAESASALDKVLTDLEKQGMKGLILDLRYNSGGFLESAIDITDLFIEDGLIVRTQPGSGTMPILALAKKSGTHPDYPLVILVNANSASASEIVAGALADKKYNRAVLVGERTHGKGKVQGITSRIGNGAELKYTVSYYHLPSGQRVESREAMEKLGKEEWGVGPNIRVTLSGPEIDKMLSIQKDNDVLVQAKRDNGGKEIEKHSKQETLTSDKQLSVALLAIKSMLIEKQNIKETAVASK